MTIETDAPATILNVDDHEAARYAKSRILRQAGYEMLEAGSGLRALEIVRARHPDLVLLDVKLPDLDGYEVCRRIRAHPATASTAVLQTSASFVDLHARVRALEGGADSYLVAPFEPEVLIASVRALLRMRRAEIELVETREAYRATFEQAPVAIAHVARDGNLMRGNKKLGSLLELDGGKQSFLERVPPERRAEVELGFARLFEEDAETFTTEIALRDSRGGEHEVALTASCVSVRQGARYLIVLLEDLHERKQAEHILAEQRAALRDVEERFRQFAENSHDVLWIYDVQRGCYEYVSPAFQRVFGFPPAEVTADPERWLEAVQEEDRASLRRNRAGSAPTATYRIVGPDGELRWIDDRQFPIHAEDGSVRRLAGIAQDVTYRRQADEVRARLLLSERSARLEAEHAGRIKDQFLATLSHELRTPLNAILGWVQLLRGRRPGEEEVDEALDVIERNARAQALLISDLLDMSRIVAGKISLEASQVDLAGIVTTAVESLRPEAQARSIALTTQLAPLEEPVCGDAARLQQVVWNLVSNAIKFSRPGGEVEVTLSRRGASAEIRVRDSGQGIAPEFLPHIFERFSQGDPSVTRQHGGLGLGLSIVRSLVELHGGRVHASSPGEGKGATFVVELPLGRDVRQTATGSGESACAGDSGVEASRLEHVRVLLVDDEPDAREFVRRILVQCGAEVRSVASAREALQSAEDFEPDILVSDIGMPEMDGYELLHAFRARIARPVPAVALTAYARDEDRRRVAREGYAAHVPKPVEPSELIRTLAAHTRRS